MTPELHKKAKQLFLAICDSDEAAREAYLNEHCAGAPDLRAEIESLLQYHTTQTLLGNAPTRAELFAHRSTEISSDRWAPGGFVGTRYRIVHKLGKGGMGEVYRAEDITLARPVALKFITAGRGTDPAWLSRFYVEARTASTITHRHVCRIYDLGEVDGEAFISMEYIDGENLAALLRRVGRLTVDKTGQLGRQLCLGLAAIHERGTLHRDLKPANVMIDGRGEVRITDFGIALGPDASATGSSAAGTPRYMAPEVLRGEPASIQSDLYALGLMLHEMLTGRPAPADTSTPNEWPADMDSRFEQVILNCLAPDPNQRPGSAIDVLSDISGQDTLSLIAAAGETPPVEMVRRSRTPSHWNRAVSTICATLTLAGLIAVFLLAGRTMLVSYAGLAQPPDVLADRAKQLLAKLGYDAARHRSREAFLLNDNAWQAVRTSPPSPTITARRLPPGRDVIGYSYALLAPAGVNSADWATFGHENAAAPIARVILDGQGRLRELDCESLPDFSSQKPAQAINRSDLFTAAGFDLHRFIEVAPTTSTNAHDGTRLWKIPDGDARVETLDRNGQILRFKVEQPSVPQSMLQAATSRLVFRAIFAATLALAVPLGWNNWRRHRSDHRGAFRIAAAMFTAQLVLYCLQQAAPAFPFGLLPWLIAGVETALLLACVVWLYYIALEPYVRRFWPQSMVSWTRVMTGCWRDPLVGRDVAVGCVLGVTIMLVMQLAAWAGLYTYHPYAGLVGPVLDWTPGRFSGYSFTLSTLAGALIHAVARGFLSMALMIMLRLITRRRGPAVAMFFAILATAYTIGIRPVTGLEIAACTLTALAATLVLDRVGFLALVTGFFVNRLLVITPLTIDMSRWYAGQSVLTALILLLLISAAFAAARTDRQPVLRS